MPDHDINFLVSENGCHFLQYRSFCQIYIQLTFFQIYSGLFVNCSNIRKMETVHEANATKQCKYLLHTCFSRVA